MNEFEKAFNVLQDDNFIEWLINYGKRLKPKSKEAYKKLCIVYFEYLKRDAKTASRQSLRRLRISNFKGKASKRL